MFESKSTSPKKNPSREAPQEPKADSEKDMDEKLQNPDTPAFQAKYAETLTAVGIELGVYEDHYEVFKGAFIKLCIDYIKLSSCAPVTGSISLRSKDFSPT